MIQAVALLQDAYRELNARKMFWITLAISVLVVGAFAAFGVSEGGITILWWEIENDLINADLVEPSLFYKWAFAMIGVPIWLTWAATILALISTASIFPDFVASGSIELLLSKPIGRLRLYFGKYLTGLLFVGLQVLVFTLACFLVIALRGGSVEWGLFLAVPIVLVFYSYLFCVMAVVGQLTRSTIAALLLTILFWLMIFALNQTEAILLFQRERYAAEIERLEERTSAMEAAAQRTIERWREDPPQSPVDPPDGAEPGPAPEPTPEQANPLLGRTRAQLAEAEENFRTWRAWHRYFFLAKTVLPKTQETIALLGQGLLSAEDMDRFQPEGEAAAADEAVQFGDPRVARRVQDVLRERSRLWIIGTSLLFEGVVLAFGAWRFSRRDF
ncbi:MAG: ABC transporter permease [Phycisphaerales bacterium JB039]